MASSGGVQLALAPNYLRQFRDSSSLELRRLSAVQFMAVWEHYDTDGGVTSKAVNEISWNVQNFLRKIRKSRSQQISENKEESQVWDKGSLLTKPSNGNRFFNRRHFPKGGGPSRVLLWMLWKHLQNFVDTSSDTVTGELMAQCCHSVAGNGFIEGEELNAFLKEFIASVNSDENLQVWHLDRYELSEVLDTFSRWQRMCSKNWKEVSWKSMMTIKMEKSISERWLNFYPWRKISSFSSDSTTP